MKFYPMAMHLHTCHQPGSSMEAQIANAAGLGMRYIRFTDHDTRTGPMEQPVRGFDFSRGTPSYSDYPGNTVSWDVSGDIAVAFDGGAMILTAAAGSGGSVRFSASGKRQAVSLLADVCLTIGMTVEAAGGACLILDAELSQRPPDHREAHLRYVLGQAAGTPPHTADLPLTAEAGGLYQLRLSEDAAAHAEEMGGLDNAFNFFTIHLEGAVRVRVDRFEIAARLGFDDVIRRQRILADEIGARYGVKPFVTTEISGAGQHKNCYTTAVPVIDYAARGYDVTQMEAIAHVKRYGGIFCYNHPFENNKYKRMEIRPEDIGWIVQAEAAQLIAARVYGAALIEVGFPAGRGAFGLADYLRLWDLLSLGGVFITGCGDSDSHYSDRGWLKGNNFATWIAAADGLSFPVAEEEFTKSMVAGRAYAGDPVLLRDPIVFTAGGAPMGAVLPVADRDTAARRMEFSAKNLPAGWRVRVIIDGMEAESYAVGEGGDFACSFSVKPARTISFARVEIYSAEGRCVCLTNPIYLVRTAEYAGEIPACRLYGEENKA